MNDKRKTVQDRMVFSCRLWMPFLLRDFEKIVVVVLGKVQYAKPAGVASRLFVSGFD